jgi:hypothetical protein
MIRSLLIAATIAATASTPKAARADEEVSQLWGAIFAQGKIAGRLRGWAEIQGRTVDGVSHFERAIVRPAIGYGLGAGFVAWAGWAWTPAYHPRFVDEHRLWQQLTHQMEQREVTLLNRFRLEERFIDGVDSPSFRVRWLARFVHRPKAWHGFGVVVWDEIFFHLNSPAGGPKAGVDQNRLGLAAQYAPSKAIIFEPTYLAIATHREGRPGRFAHTFLLAVWLNW